MEDIVDNEKRHKLALLMGIVIAVADIYWIYTSYKYFVWLALGVIILAADLIWLYLDIE